MFCYIHKSFKHTYLTNTFVFAIKKKNNYVQKRLEINFTIKKNFTLVKNVNQSHTEQKGISISTKINLNGMGNLKCSLPQMPLLHFHFIKLNIRPLTVRIKSLWLWHHDKEICWLRHHENYVTVVVYYQIQKNKDRQKVIIMHLTP